MRNLLHLACLVGVIAFITAAPAQAATKTHAEISEAAFNYTALQPGQQAVAAVVLDIRDGFHTQSHTPSEPQYIAFEAKADSGSSVVIYEPTYPSGETHEYGDLGKLNVYTGRVIIYFPVQVKPDAVPGSIKFSGSLHYQACDNNVCFRPEDLKFNIETTIVAAGAKVEAQKPELFKGFDPKTFSRLQPGAVPTTLPSTSSPSGPAGASFDVFGHQFTIGSNSWAIALGLAFVVGIIFNLMPCVLPVLPLKAIGFYEVSQHNRAKSIFLGTVFSSGVLACFAVLAVLILVLKKLSWGQQFSSPYFVWPIVILLTAMALGMFGAFTLLLPTGVYNFAPRHDTVSGNFLFGIFTAVLSTPCTAPMFVGLLAWAALQPQWLGVTTVLMVGVGMASPYFLLSALPEVARRFPRSGAWAELVKQLMGFLLLAVAVYFAGGRLFHSRDFFWAVFVVLLAGCVFLVVRTAQFSGKAPAVTAASLIALLVAGISLYFTLAVTGKLQSGKGELIAWTPYSQTAVDEARASGKIVMVEFTANWCANCLELEARVFHNQRAADALAQKGVATFRADLTSDDAPGWTRLRELNASGGIPLTAIYPAGSSSSPIQLSSTYTVQNLVDALARASETGNVTAAAR